MPESTNTKTLASHQVKAHGTPVEKHCHTPTKQYRYIYWCSNNVGVIDSRSAKKDWEKIIGHLV